MAAQRMRIMLPESLPAIGNHDAAPLTYPEDRTIARANPMLAEE